VARTRSRRLPLSHRRSFVRRHTRLREVDGLPGIRLHLADEVEHLWPATERELGTDGAPVPFWAFAWAGGLSLAGYLLDHPDEVRGRRVIDVASGSGLVAIAAAKAGAAVVTANDIDPFAEAAVGLNARANGIRVGWDGRDLLAGPPPGADVVLCADAWYEAPLAERVTAWLRACAAAGARVLAGDPGRRYLPQTGMRELARRDVQTTTILEDRDRVEARVLLVEPAPAASIRG
jgi:predicted nicotinamide N-methyase